MTNQCTCTIDKEATCIVHPTTRSLKERIQQLEAALRKRSGLSREEAGDVLRENAALRDAAQEVVDEYRYAVRAGMDVVYISEEIDALAALLPKGVMYE